MQNARLLSSTWVRELFHHLIQGEAGRFLTRWKLLEGGEELADIILGWHQQVGAIDQPIVVGIGGELGAFVGIATQVEHTCKVPCTRCSMKISFQSL